MTACTQPGCRGSILDGYCDVCGMPEEAPPTTSGGSGSVPRRGVSCPQPACSGTIVDGYCDVCGMPPEPTSFSTATAPARSGSGTTPVVVRDRSVATGGIDSAALGSARAGSSGLSRRTSVGSRRLRAARLGAGLTTVPPAPAIDAAKVILADPEVPEDKRVCPYCGNPVGRSQDGRPGRTEGFCSQCRKPYSFAPKLEAGELVAGQYQVAGALAHGGLGWIYLARDRNVSDRWVVLKGLLNSGDADAMAAAIAEQQFLAQVEHPLIVEIYNFVMHQGAGYIVMEYVGGTSLKQILKDRMRANDGDYDPLPVDQALAYILEVLPAFQYLHDMGLLYCDFKPDNIIQIGDAIKLIDLGGVRRIDDLHSAIYGTVGYQAPEVPEVGPSIASDIWTIGRTLLVLCMEFRGYQTTHVASLPDPATTPLFQEHDSLYWLIAKCCAPDPADRFASADELRTQLLGVLREVVAEKTPGTALTSASSALFESPAISTAELSWSQLPKLRPDTTDPQHAWLSSITAADPQQRLTDLRQAPEDSPEVHIERCRALLELDAPARVREIADQMLRDDPWEWRALWLTGLAAMQGSDWASARSSFSAVYQQVPGELAPKLALAVACERSGEGAIAEALYSTCVQTDASYVAPAAFGMARVRGTRGDLTGAVAALDLVPSTSRGYPEARRLRAQILVTSSHGDLAVLDQAFTSIEGVRMDPIDRNRFLAKILEEALEVVNSAGSAGAPKNATVGPYAATTASLRAGLEQAYRAQARETPDRLARIALVNQANEIRNWTLT